MVLVLVLRQKKWPKRYHLGHLGSMTGFEPATPSSRTKYATGLRYIPKIKFNYPVHVSASAFFKELLHSCKQFLSASSQD